MIVYITKYALTQGIQVRNGHVSEDGRYARSEDRVKLGSPYYFFLRWGLDAWPDREQAEARVREMCIAKLKSLEKSREKVEKTFLAHGGSPTDEALEL